MFYNRSTQKRSPIISQFLTLFQLVTEYSGCQRALGQNPKVFLFSIINIISQQFLGVLEMKCNQIPDQKPSGDGLHTLFNKSMISQRGRFTNQADFENCVSLAGVSNLSVSVLPGKWIRNDRLIRTIQEPRDAVLNLMWLRDEKSETRNRKRLHKVQLLYSYSGSSSLIASFSSLLKKTCMALSRCGPVSILDRTMWKKQFFKKKNSIMA